MPALVLWLVILGECGVVSLASRGTGGCGTLCGRSGCYGQPSFAGIATFRSKSLSRYVPRVFCSEV